MERNLQTAVAYDLDIEGARAYCSHRFSMPESSLAVTELSGGVSNRVVLVTFADGRRIVLKQALPQLRVAEPWFSDPSRALREANAIGVLSECLPPGTVPDVIFIDPEQNAFGISAAPADAVPWKSLLLRGEVSISVASRIGTLHGSMIQATWGSERYAADFGDQTAFDELRLDPYYRFTAARHRDLAPLFESAIARCVNQRRCLVHGDWSPKNLLVTADRVIAIDFEVVHYGDPGFDTGFLLNHLLLKSFHRPQDAAAYSHAAGAYWNAVMTKCLDSEWLLEGTMLHLPLLMLARMDGKSPVEYITNDEVRGRVRSFACSLLARPAKTVSEIFDRLPL